MYVTGDRTHNTGLIHVEKTNLGTYAVRIWGRVTFTSPHVWPTSVHEKGRDYVCMFVWSLTSMRRMSIDSTVVKKNICKKKSDTSPTTANRQNSCNRDKPEQISDQSTATRPATGQVKRLPLIASEPSFHRTLERLLRESEPGLISVWGRQAVETWG